VINQDFKKEVALLRGSYSSWDKVPFAVQFSGTDFYTWLSRYHPEIADGVAAYIVETEGKYDLSNVFTVLSIIDSGSGDDSISLQCLADYALYNKHIGELIYEKVKDYRRENYARRVC